VYSEFDYIFDQELISSGYFCSFFLFHFSSDLLHWYCLACLWTLQ